MDFVLNISSPPMPITSGPKLDLPSGRESRDGASKDNGTEDTALAGILLVVGSLPFVGLLILGYWSQWELGMGAALITFAAYQLLRHALPWGRD